MMNRIQNLDITPAQLALDPCSGSMAITDVNTGDVLALVSYPGYDNNKMANGEDAEYFAALQSDLSTPLIDGICNSWIKGGDYQYHLNFFL